MGKRRAKNYVNKEDELYLLYYSKEKCPECGNILLKNELGDKVCIDNRCTYGTGDISYIEIKKC